jgi:fluoride exporter
VSAELVVAIGLVGGVGALGRFVLDGAVAGRVGRSFPYGTLAVNLTGSVLLGLLVGLGAERDTMRVLGGGLLGAYTTFSTWALESHRLAEDGEFRPAALNFAVSLVLGVAAAWVGREIGGSL